MKLTIFGATSATGKHLVKKALTAGDEVIAFVRDVSNEIGAHT
jgi:putative NADH-flavin reductase